MNQVNRMHISLINELFVMIQKNKAVLDEDAFERVLKSMRRESRACWQELVDAALDRSKLLNKDLMLIRHKIGFHYDPKEIMSGYEHFFTKRSITDKAYLSRGTNWAESRFFFADAAAESYMHRRAEPEDINTLYGRVRQFSNKLNSAIWNMVTTFIQHRGYSYHEHRPDDASSS